MSAVAATPIDGPTQPPKSDRFPAGIPFIVANEGAERFSYYGMRQILFVHLAALFVGFQGIDVVGQAAMAEANVRATQWTHQFFAAVYLFPMIGAILSDRLLGKYRVIFWVSLLYVVGHAVLAVAGRTASMGNFPAAELGMFVGLGLIALGAGGIKPCVSANVGDQFTKENGHLVGKVFQIFYFIINFGSFYASFFIPILYYMDKDKPLHERVGPEIAFGVPGVLMAIAAVAFWAGRNKYIKQPPKPGGKLGALDFISSSLLATPLLVLVLAGAPAAEPVVHAAFSDGGATVGEALGTVASEFWPHFLVAVVGFVLGVALFAYRQRLKRDTGFFSIMLYSWEHRRERVAGQSFFSPAAKEFGDEAAEGPGAVLRVIAVFCMVCVFWALFDQHASTWVAQAKSMNRGFDVVTWLPPYAKFLAFTGGGIGATWLLLWVSNIRLPRWIWLAAAGALLAAAPIFIGAYGGEPLHVELEAAQISTLNPLFVMIIIPALNVLVYGPMERRGRPLRPLQRMTIGMFAASVAFATVALLQARIESSGPGQLHVLWQIIPYFIMTAGEVLVSITGLEFAYTQAPRAMKSTVMGFWLLFISLGDVLVAFLAPLQTLLSMSAFFWTFAVLMAGAAAVFMLMAYRYKGKTYLQEA